MRCRSLAGIVRNARCADLATSKSQLTLEVFKTDAFPAGVFIIRAASPRFSSGRGSSTGIVSLRLATVMYRRSVRAAARSASGAALANAIELVNQRPPAALPPRSLSSMRSSELSIQAPQLLDPRNREARKSVSRARSAAIGRAASKPSTERGNRVYPWKKSSLS